MPEVTMKNGWGTWNFDQIAVEVKDRIDDPRQADHDRYVGLKHLDSGSLKIWRWGSTKDVEKTKLLFKSGDIIFGRRNAYLRRVAVADFDGVCSAHAMVLRAQPEVALPEFLPFFMQTDAFWEAALRNSAGSISPTINWSNIAKEKFTLPPLEEQRRIAEGLQAVEDCKVSLRRAAAASQVAFDSLCLHQVTKEGRYSGFHPTNWAPEDWAVRPLEEAVAPGAPICYGIVQVGNDVPDGIPTLRIDNLGGDYRDGLHRTAKAIEKKYARSRVEPGDVIVSIEGTIGEIDIVPLHFSGNISRHIARIRLKPEILRPRFFLYLYRSMPYRRYTQSLLVGSTRAELSIAAIRKMAVPCPALDEQDRIAHELETMAKATEEFEKRESNLMDFQRRLRESALTAEVGQ